MSRFTPGGRVALRRRRREQAPASHSESLNQLGVTVAAAKMPDVVVYDSSRNELKELFAGSAAGLVFVKAFPSRDTMRSILPHISWKPKSGSRKHRTTRRSGKLDQALILLGDGERLKSILPQTEIDYNEASAEYATPMQSAVQTTQ